MVSDVKMRRAAAAAGELRALFRAERQEEDEQDQQVLGGAEVYRHRAQHQAVSGLVGCACGSRLREPGPTQAGGAAFQAGYGVGATVLDDPGGVGDRRTGGVGGGGDDPVVRGPRLRAL